MVTPDLSDLSDDAVIGVIKPLAAWTVHLKDSAATPDTYKAADRILTALDAELAQRKANIARKRASHHATAPAA